MPAGGEEARRTPGERKKADIVVPSSDPARSSSDPDGVKPRPAPERKVSEDEHTEEEVDEALEDAKLRAELEALVEVVVAKVPSGDGAQAAKEAVDTLAQKIRDATSSMTSIPLPLKYLKPHYGALKAAQAKGSSAASASDAAAANLRVLSDVLSVLGMTMQEDGARECLRFKLAGNLSDIGSWGHEYLRFLTAEITLEWDERSSGKDAGAEADASWKVELLALIDEIVQYNMKHNTEHEACDLLLEIEDVERLLPHVDEENFPKVCEYYLQCSQYVPEPDDGLLRDLVYRIFRKMDELPEAMRVAMIMNDNDKIVECYEACTDETKGNEDGLLKKQLALILGRQRVNHEDEEDPDTNELISNVGLSEYFMALAQDLDIVEAKEPEEVYKSNADSKAAASAQSQVDSARGNLASTFVNAFVNAGFGQDKVMTGEDGNTWIYKNKEHGMMSAAASLGCILQWDVDGGLAQIDKFLYASEDYIKAGALLGVGIVNAGVRNDCDPALALLSEYLEPGAAHSTAMRCGAALGMGLAYARSAREDVLEFLQPLIEDPDAPFEVICIASLAAGLVFVGTAHPELTEVFCEALMERSETDLSSSSARFLALALGLLYLRRQEDADVTLATLAACEHPFAKEYASLTVETCAYAGSGDVLKIQKWLDIAGDHLNEDEEEEDAASEGGAAAAAAAGAEGGDAEKKDDEKKGSKVYDGHQSVAVLGLALAALGEDIGAEMLLRSAEHLLQYGDASVRRAVPLALGVLSASNPKASIVDTLSKLSHDVDPDVSQAAIFALGVVSAGTNNARVANVLRGLAQYYYKEADHLFLVRVSQGLLFLGKGTMTLSPFHSDRSVLSPIALSGLLVVMHACLDAKNTLFKHQHYLLYTLMLSAQPRFLMTLDAELKPLEVSVRVGQAVDVVGQAGKPKTITGFQTHTTPVLFGHGDRAELATDEYLPVCRVLEGLVILRKNPEWKDPNEGKKESDAN